jgi:hypothetical protein
MTSSASAPAASPDRPRRRFRTLLIVLGVLAVPFLLFSLYVGLMFVWSYSDGERSGILQKFSHKGWLCKTYEGELAMTTVPGVAPTVWQFSARDEAVVPRLRGAIGKKVVLHYTEHRGIPTNCFGSTSYFVDSVRVVE